MKLSDDNDEKERNQRKWFEQEEKKNYLKIRFGSFVATVVVLVWGSLFKKIKHTLDDKYFRSVFLLITKMK